MLLFALICIKLLTSMATISYANSTQPIQFLQPYWPTKQDVDPTDRISVGDWDIFQNMYSTIVEMASAIAVKPALAEKWTQSANGKRWVFYLRKNLLWSDGSPMTTEQVVASLKRSAKGTNHTNFSGYVEQINVLANNQIEMQLKRTPPNFLTLLSFVDCSIVHPSAYEKSLFTWRSQSSGAFRVSSYSDSQIELVANPYYWDNSPDRVQRATLIRPQNSSPKDRMSTLLKSSWDASQIDAGIIQDFSEVENLKQKYDVFVGTPDFLFSIYFSRKRTLNGRLSDALRQHFFKSIYDDFWKQSRNNSFRAIGMRFPGKKGSITAAEFDKIFSEMKKALVDKQKIFPKTIEILLGKTNKSKPAIDRVYAIIRSLGFSIKEIYSEDALVVRKYQKSGEYDLYISFVGVSEDDPDTVWRYYSDYFAKPVTTTEELDKAQLEPDATKRNQMYQEFEKRAIERALFIPLKYEPTYIVTSKRVVLDTTLAADWGLQLFKLRMR